MKQVTNFPLDGKYKYLFYDFLSFKKKKKKIFLLL